MKVFRRHLVIYSAIIVICVIFLVILFRAYGLEDNSLIRQDDVISLSTDIDGWFPIDELGRPVTMNELSEEYQIILRDKIRNADPIEAAKLAFERGDHRLMMIFRGSKIGIMDTKCKRILGPKPRLVLNFGSRPVGHIADNIFDSYGKFSVQYNHEILQNSPKGMWHDCKIRSKWGSWP